MSVEDCDIVDIVSVNKQTGEVTLTVSDHLEWFDSSKHQLILQTKLNRYLAFVESRELLESYPDAKGRSVVIRVVLKFAPDQSGREFLDRAEEVVITAGIGFRCEIFADSYCN